MSRSLLLLPVAVCVYGVIGAAIGALVEGSRGRSRFRELQLVASANTGQPRSPPPAEQPGG